MKTRSAHKIIGITMLLPFFTWAATAVFFLVRPAYEEAYAQLDVKRYPLVAPLRFNVGADWEEVRYLRSILGNHLLVRREDSWVQLDPGTLREAEYPDPDSLKLLAEDAFTSNPGRYGKVSAMEGAALSTDTGVNISFDWNTLSFAQEGPDTRMINRVYSIHYLEWTGVAVLDRILGLAGLSLLIAMTWTGARLALGFGRAGRTRPLANRQQTGLQDMGRQERV